MQLTLSNLLFSSLDLPQSPEWKGLVSFDEEVVLVLKEVVLGVVVRILVSMTVRMEVVLIEVRRHEYRHRQSHLVRKCRS